MAQLVKVLATKPEDLSLSPGPHLVKGGNCVVVVVPLSEIQQFFFLIS